MDLDWKDLAGKVIGIGAPMLGQALGGPLGGAAGKILADALGVDPTPTAVQTKLDTDPVGSATAAQTAEGEVAKWAALAKIAESKTEAEKSDNDVLKTEIVEQNATWRLEAASGDAFERRQRPFDGYELTIECFMFTLTVCFTILRGDVQMINAIAGLTALLSMYFGGRLALRGVHSFGRNKLKKTALEQDITRQSPVAAVLTAATQVLAKKPTTGKK